MLNNTNMGVGDGRPKYLHVQQVKLEKVIILIAFFCKVVLLCNITARRVEKLCCAFYHSHVQAAVLQQFRLLQVARILVFDWLRVSWGHTKHRLTSPEDATCYKPSLSLAGKAPNIFRFCSKKQNFLLFSATTFRDLQQSDMFQKGLICVVKRATQFFNSSCRNVAKKLHVFVSRFTLPLRSASYCKSFGWFWNDQQQTIFLIMAIEILKKHRENCVSYIYL